MTPILAEQIASNINWSLIATIIMAVATFGMWLDARKQRRVAVEQPVDVQIVKQLHEQFAGREEFEAHLQHNTERHGQLFKRIDEVERAGRKELEKRVAEINDDRRKTMEKLNTEFVFIRENLIELKTELKIRHEA